MFNFLNVLISKTESVSYCDSSQRASRFASQYGIRSVHNYIGDKTLIENDKGNSAYVWDRYVIIANVRACRVECTLDTVTDIHGYKLF